MKILTILLYVVAIFLGSFGYWGVFTKAGRKEYDEMNGFYPGFALLGAAVLLLVAFILTIVIFVKYCRFRKSTIIRER
ncbi:MAG: hypothetical protein K0S33_2814 [Bacteroidetes bacterium]|jgi:hypothetical protein|nr:hypothetical protein [Bacteroidota bacterium]